MANFKKKIELLGRLAGTLSAATHQSESAAVKCSWLYPLIQAFYTDANEWTNSTAANCYFTLETRNAVLASILNRWNGNERRVPLKYLPLC